MKKNAAGRMAAKRRGERKYHTPSNEINWTARV